MKVPRFNFSTCRILVAQEPGLISGLERRYEKLVNLINDYGGRVHGSQHSVLGQNYHCIVTYFDIPKDSLEAFLKEEKE